jgi:hypothetical protein
MTEIQGRAIRPRSQLTPRGENRGTSIHVSGVFHETGT